MDKKTRTGIAAGGNWIADRVKIVDRLPGRGMLGNILSQAVGTGGAPANVLVDLARMGAPFPLSGYGVVGNDADGRYVVESARKQGLDMSGIVFTDAAPTSFTDVMSESGTGDRSYFHCRGANALFGPEHVNIALLDCRIFHLGYLLLLDRMDQPDPQHGTVAAQFLHAIQAAGIKTSVDVVSEESDRFHLLVPPALKYVDYLILNEIEAGRAVERRVRRENGTLDPSALRITAESLHALGAMTFVAIHMLEGVFVMEKNGRGFSIGSLIVPPAFIRSTAGAGDAFCAGMLYGLHEGWDLRRAAETGIACATACLSDDTTTGGVGSLAECLSLLKRFPHRPPPVPS